MTLFSLQKDLRDYGYKRKRKVGGEEGRPVNCNFLVTSFLRHLRAFFHLSHLPRTFLTLHTSRMGNLIGSSVSSIKDPAAFVQTSLSSGANAGKVVVFSKSYCPSCSATKRLLASLNVPVEVIELDSYGEPRNGPVQQALQAITGNIATPQVFSLGGTYVGGNSELQSFQRAGTLEGKLRS